MVPGIVGLKLVVEGLHGEHVEHISRRTVPQISTLFSLCVIAAALALAAAASLVSSRTGETVARGE